MNARRAAILILVKEKQQKELEESSARVMKYWRKWLNFGSEGPDMSTAEMEPYTSLATFNILKPSCLPSDLRSIIDEAEQMGFHIKWDVSGYHVEITDVRLQREIEDMQ
jgi:hypothetical protein